MDTRRPFSEGGQVPHQVDLTVSGVRLTGRTASVGGRVLHTGYSTPADKHVAEAWVDALALSAQLGRPVDAVVVGRRGRGNSGRRTLAGVDPTTAIQLLTRLVNLAIDGMERVLPMPPRVSRAWAVARASNQDPITERLGWTWREEADEVWRLFLPGDANPWDARVTDEIWGQPGEPTVLGSLAALVWIDREVRAVKRFDLRARFRGASPFWGLGRHGQDTRSRRWRSGSPRTSWTPPGLLLVTFSRAATAELHQGAGRFVLC